MRACNCARASPLQSRTRVGCDSMRNTFDIVSSQFQSTHPRGVRRLPAGRHEIPDRFQSTHPRGVRPGERHAAFFCSSFQSTHPRGVRLSGAVKSPGAFLGFNPRTRVGCDCGCWCGPTASSRFNPRTRVGCDLPALAPFSFIVRFQSTHPRGVRLQHIGQQEVYTKVSIHAPAWGATGRGWQGV